MNIEQIKLVSERYYQLYLQGQTEKYALMEKKLTINFNPPPRWKNVRWNRGDC